MQARYSVGTRVKVREDIPKGHCRTPFYLRGHAGVIEHEMGPFLDPEKMGHGMPGLPMRMLYRVRFEQPAIWPQYPADARSDTLVADLFEHWLDPSE